MRHDPSRGSRSRHRLMYTALTRPAAPASSELVAGAEHAGAAALLVGGGNGLARTGADPREPQIDLAQAQPESEARVVAHAEHAVGGAARQTRQRAHVHEGP